MSMRFRKVGFSIYLEPEQYTALKTLGEKARVPMCVLVRHGIDMLLAKAEKIEFEPLSTSSASTEGSSK